MELKLVYRALRQISDWSLAFYSEIHVDGQENVPPDGPLIVASSHHNEILDIATLCVTIPHRRPLCFWAKSTLFKNALARAILLSSGSIPVLRNPNSGAAAGSTSADFHQALFRETFRALDAGEVVGVFPEGTSYTEPHIVQVKDGAARAALEYMRWCGDKRDAEKPGKPLVIVPVGIVYTDKSQYQSRVRVRWGKPIDIQPFVERYLSDAEVDPWTVVRSLTSEIEKRMVELTINAPDWDTVYAAKVVRDILCDERTIPLEDYVEVTRSYINLTNRTDDTTLSAIRASLLKYYSLLHYTGISHASLSAVFPDPHAPITRNRAVLAFLQQLAATVRHPRFLLFLPMVLLHLPVYCMACLGDRLSTPGEEEGRAQYKAVVGGLAAAAVYAAVGRTVARAAAAASVGPSSNTSQNMLLQMLRHAGAWCFSGGMARRAVGTVGVMYGTAWVLFRWHNALVEGNYAQFKRLLASFRILGGLFSPPSADVSLRDLGPYTVPLKAPVNPYIKRRTAGTPDAVQGDVVDRHSPPAVPSRRLIRHLLAARIEANKATLDLVKRVQP